MLIVYAYTPSDSSVIVKNWQFNEPPSGPTQHPYIESLDAFDLPGIPGQGNQNPPGSKVRRNLL